LERPGEVAAPTDCTRVGPRAGPCAMGGNVYLYVPNVIGYVRIVLNLVALNFALSDHKVSLTCYALSTLLDAADGFAARVLHQSSLFGAVLDMVTDRTATATLCVVLAHLYPAYLVTFCALIMLDIFSHWAHVYASALRLASTHKSSSNWIVRLYYYKPILFFVCAGNEVFYMCLYLLAFEEGQFLADAWLPIWGHVRVTSVRAGLACCAPVFAFKQVTNVIQMLIAFRAINESEGAQKKD